jgi:hypothetical protein
MRKLLGVSVAVILCVIVAAIVVRARQDKSKRPSLPATAKCELAVENRSRVTFRARA